MAVRGDNCCPSAGRSDGRPRGNLMAACGEIAVTVDTRPKDAGARELPHELRLLRLQERQDLTPTPSPTLSWPHRPSLADYPAALLVSCVGRIRRDTHEQRDVPLGAGYGPLTAPSSGNQTPSRYRTSSGSSEPSGHGSARLTSRDR